MLSLTGGLDRQVHDFRVGVLYTHALARTETELQRDALAFVSREPALGTA